MKIDLLEKLYNVVLSDNSVDIVVLPVKYFVENNNVVSICIPKGYYEQFS